MCVLQSSVGKENAEAEPIPHTKLLHRVKKSSDASRRTNENTTASLPKEKATGGSREAKKTVLGERRRSSRITINA